MRTSARRCFTSGALCVFAAHLYILLHPRDKCLFIDLEYQKAAPIHSVLHRMRLLAEGTGLSEIRGAPSAAKDDLPVISEQGFELCPEHGPAYILYLVPWVLYVPFCIIDRTSLCFHLGTFCRNIGCNDSTMSIVKRRINIQPVFSIHLVIDIVS